MASPQNLDEFIHEARSQGQRRIRIAIVGDPSMKPWTVRVEAYNKLYFETESEDAAIFEELQSKLRNSGFDTSLVTRQPYEGKIDPQLLEVFSRMPPTGDNKGSRRRRGK